MVVDLDKEDLVNLVAGVEPYYSVFEHPLVKQCGGFRASYNEWDWSKFGLRELTEEQLLEVYNVCKNSWK